MKFDFKESRIISNGNTILKVIISPNATAARRDERAARRARGATSAQRSVGLGLVEIVSWMRHWTVV